MMVQEVKPRDVRALEASISQLSPRSREFASSLCQQYWKRGYLSERQEPWVWKLIDEATKPAEPETTINAEPLFAKFAEAQKHIQFPKLIFDSPVGKVKLHPAGEMAKYPGSITIKVDGGWVGRIHKDGRLEVRNHKEELKEILDGFAADPHAYAVKHGHDVGWCCFCGLMLTDPRSKSAGYGPYCAENWGLPWG
jgi:hypothetical protein